MNDQFDDGYESLGCDIFFALAAKDSVVLKTPEEIRDLYMTCLKGAELIYQDLPSEPDPKPTKPSPNNVVPLLRAA